MVYDVTVIVPEGRDRDEGYIRKEAGRILQAQGQRVNLNGAQLVIEKRSVDARRRQIKIVLRCRLYVGEKAAAEERLPVWL
ncbi:MAG: hypothetical protein II932_08710, partial [Treponema sp.]|nr:hypothetical protein [Treponema sp.]